MGQQTAGPRTTLMALNGIRAAIIENVRTKLNIARRRTLILSDHQVRFKEQAICTGTALGQSLTPMELFYRWIIRGDCATSSAMHRAAINTFQDWFWRLDADVHIVDHVATSPWRTKFSTSAFASAIARSMSSAAIIFSWGRIRTQRSPNSANRWRNFAICSCRKSTNSGHDKNTYCCSASAWLAIEFYTTQV